MNTLAASLLQSQLDALEEPESGLSVDISDTVEQICQTIINKLSVS
jgi:gluconate kinase